MARRNALIRSLELGAAAPAVIAMRTARMMAAGASPTPADRRETSRMVSEKIDAFGTSWWMMASRQQQAALEAWMAFARAWWAPWLRGFALPSSTVARRDLQRLQRSLSRSQAAVYAVGLAPLHRAATANLRRLTRRPRHRQ
jgi:hypothetical protein